MRKKRKLSLSLFFAYLFEKKLFRAFSFPSRKGSKNEKKEKVGKKAFVKKNAVFLFENLNKA